jgi:hypothetical protein
VDTAEAGKGRKPFAWLAEAMPQLPGRVRELRAEYGDRHVNECWRRGVVGGETGWFFARQGVVTIGAPFVGDPVLSDFAAQHLQADQCLVVIRQPGATHGP